MKWGISLILIFNLVLTSFASGLNPDCKEVLNWIYRDLTMKNLELSYERSMDKLLLALYYSHENTKNDRRFTEHDFNQLFNSLRNIDSKLTPVIQNNKTNYWTSVWANFGFGAATPTRLSQENLANALKEMKDLQKSRPDLFKGMDEKYMLDDWDMQTSKILTEISNYNFENSQLKEKLENLSKKIQASKADILNSKGFTQNDLEKEINSTHQEMVSTLNDNYKDILDEFSTVCSEDELNLYLNSNEQYICPVPKNNISIEGLNEQLLSLQKILDDSGILSSERPEFPIQVLDYETNQREDATFCKRDPEMVTMIVVHHTGTDNDTTPYQINQLHLNNSTEGDPWYMIGYNYLISETFQGSSEDNPLVFQGRAPNLKGAHAGGYTAKLSEEERQFYSQYKVECGNDKIGFENSPLSDQIGKAGGLSGNLASFGIAVIGNFAPIKWKTINGLQQPKNLYVTRVESPSAAIVDKLAKLSCNLQKQYPNVKKIVPHQYFRNTECPGSLVHFLGQVKDRAKDLGCDFEVELSKGED